MIKNGLKQIVSLKEMKKAESWLDNFKKSPGYLQLDLFGNHRIYWRPVLTLGLYYMQKIYFDFSCKLSDDRIPYAVFDRHRSDITFGQFWDHMYGITGFSTGELEELFSHLENEYGHLFMQILYIDKDKNQKCPEDKRTEEKKGSLDFKFQCTDDMPHEPVYVKPIIRYNIGIS